MNESMNNQVAGNGIQSDEVRRLPAMPSNHALDARADGGNENGECRSLVPYRAERRDIDARKRKPKHRQRREPMPQPPKAMWPAIVCLILAGLYVLSPVDIIPDFPVVGVWDDIIIAVLGLRKFERDRKAGDSTRPQLRPPVDGRFMSEPFDDGRRMPSQRLYPHSMPVDEPGFFGRLWKAFTYLFTGGGAL